MDHTGPAPISNLIPARCKNIWGNSDDGLCWLTAINIPHGRCKDNTFVDSSAVCFSTRWRANLQHLYEAPRIPNLNANDRLQIVLRRRAALFTTLTKAHSSQTLLSLCTQQLSATSLTRRPKLSSTTVSYLRMWEDAKPRRERLVLNAAREESGEFGWLLNISFIYFIFF